MIFHDSRLCSFCLNKKSIMNEFVQRKFKCLLDRSSALIGRNVLFFISNNFDIFTSIFVLFYSTWRLPLTKSLVWLPTDEQRLIRSVVSSKRHSVIVSSIRYTFRYNTSINNKPINCS